MTLSSITTAIVYHSGYGHTKRMAEAVAEGAAASLIAIDAEGNIPEDGWETLNAADAIIFGSPTYMGGPSWQFKKFADASSKPWFEEKWKNKIFGGFTNSASMTSSVMATSSTRYNTSSCWPASTAAFGSASPSSQPTSKHRSATIRTGMGSYIAPMAQSDADAAPGEMSEGDLETARLYGVRVAEIASRFRGCTERLSLRPIRACGVEWPELSMPLPSTRYNTSSCWPASTAACCHTAVVVQQDVSDDAYAAADGFRRVAGQQPHRSGRHVSDDSSSVVNSMPAASSARRSATMTEGSAAAARLC